MGTFVRCALERRVLDSRTVPFIVSFLASCVKEVTLLIIMALVVNLYMATNSMMKILPLSTLVQVYYLWQTLVQTPMDRNFFFAQPKLIGLMARMLFLLSKRMDPKMGRQAKQLQLQIVELCSSKLDVSLFIDLVSIFVAIK